MSKPIPPVQKYMSTTPTTIAPEAPIADAHSVMRESHIRHLPVCHDGDVVGLLSEGDLYRAESLRGAVASKLKVKDVMTAKPYMVKPSSPLDEVVTEMARSKVGSAVVVDNHRVVGLFTATDALGALAELLHTRL